MIYIVDTHRIDRQIGCLKGCIQVLCDLEDTSLDNPIYSFALARALHISIEAMVDIGTVLIDGFIMRDPGGYMDIIEILEDEKVLSGDLAMEIKEFIQLREPLVRNYDTLLGFEMISFINKVQVLERFIVSVNCYLAEESM